MFQGPFKKLGPSPSATTPAVGATTSSLPAAQRAEDDARKKKTDCVYFLASPLTCKKGSECEYRHSEYARVNPRDCWFWMNGNCLNPKCSFRHPPLDSLLAPQAASSSCSSAVGSSGSSLPSSQSVLSTQYATAKQAAPCIFFQKGYCLKGDFCPFSHLMQHPTSSKPSQFSPALGRSEPASSKKPLGGLEKCSQQKTLSQANVKAASALDINGASAEKYEQKPLAFVCEEPSEQKMTTPHLLDNGSLRSKSGHAILYHASSLEDQSFQNGNDVDESLRESSPGFDVLVDSQRGGPAFYGDKKLIPRTRDCDGSYVSKFEIGHLDDRSAGLDMYNDHCGCDRYEERYAWDHLHSSSERPLIEAAHFDQRVGMCGEESPDRTENSDLRLCLLKRRRSSGLRSVVNPDSAPGNHSREQSYRSSQRDSSHSLPPHESSFSSRLQGRIKLPRASSVKSTNEEYDRVRNQGRLSPMKPPLSSRCGRIQDRLSGRVRQDDFVVASPRIRRDVINDQGTNFSGPKSLAELKSAKQSKKEQRTRTQESTSLGKRKALEGSQDDEVDLSFEGPKPLSEILKRKRETGSASSVSAQVPDIKDRSMLSSVAGISDKPAPEHQTNVSAPENNEEIDSPVHEEENSKSVSASESEAKDHDSCNMNKLVETESSRLKKVNRVKDNKYEDEYEQKRDGEYEYEGEDGEEGYNVEEGEDGGLSEDYMDEDDRDDFAKKIGVVFS